MADKSEKVPIPICFVKQLNTYILKLRFENGMISVCLLSCVRLGVADG